MVGLVLGFWRIRIFSEDEVCIIRTDQLGNAYLAYDNICCQFLPVCYQHPALYICDIFKPN